MYRVDMEYRDRALAAVRRAEEHLRAELRPIIVEAVAAEAYADVASIARLTEELSNLLRHVTTDKRPPAGPAAERVAQEQREPTTPMAEPHSPRATSRRVQYPQFLRDGDRLVKIGWSKKTRTTYEHKAPRAVVEALVAAVQRRKGENAVFQASDVMPLKDSLREEYPSYQSYLALNWLRDVGAIRKRGREGYVLKKGAVTAEALVTLWELLPVAESNP